LKHIFVIALAVLALFSAAVSAQDTIEQKKIEFLLSSVENLNGAKFIRNGSEHDGKKAAELLRMKLQKTGNNVKTANDFISLTLDFREWTCSLKKVESAQINT
jgi:hypothetical protein